MEYRILSEELFHAQIDFFSSNGDVSALYSGLVSSRQCKTRDDMVLFVDFDKDSQKSQDLLDFFTLHQDDLNAHVTSITGQKELTITCFHCSVITVYRKDAKTLIGSCGKLIEITCESWIENELINTLDDVLRWDSVFISVCGLHLFSASKEEFDYSITFKNKDEIAFVYSNIFSRIFMTNDRSYKLPVSSERSFIIINFLRNMSVREILRYVYSFMSFLRFIFGVEISFGPLIRDDYSIECENGVQKQRPSFWLKDSTRIKSNFEIEASIDPIFDIPYLEANSDVLFEKWNKAYIEHQLSVTVLERINRNPKCNSEFVDDTAKIVRAIAQLVNFKTPDGKTPSNEARIAKAIEKTDSVYTLDDAKKLAEIRNSDSHSKEMSPDIVSMDEMPRLRTIAIDLFKAYITKCLLLLQ